MGKYNITYEGSLRTTTTHLDNGAILKTDAPKDNQGKGEEFSPTDLLAVSLGTCILTLMGIAAKNKGLDLTGLRAEVEKEMALLPKRRIGRVVVHIFCPQVFDAKETELLEHAGLGCPVHESLHPDIQQEIDFYWGQK